MRALPLLAPILFVTLALFCGIPAVSQAAQPFAAPGSAREQASPSSTGQAAVATSDDATPGSRFLHALSEPLVYAMMVQQRYYRSMAQALRSVASEHSAAAAWTLVSLSFAYGIFHAVGPGHGKVVVTSYLLAGEREVRRGVLLAFLSAFAQAVTAIVAVGTLAVVLGLTRRSVTGALPVIEQASFALVAALGAWLLWRSLKCGHGGAHDHAHCDEHDDHHHGHAHLPTPKEIDANRGWRSMAAMILAVGLRPCTGAVLVLLFALAQDTFVVGAVSAFAMSFGTAMTVSTLAALAVASKNTALRIASRTDNPWTHRIERGLEIGGGLFILTMGLFLLAGSFLAPAQPFF